MGAENTASDFYFTIGNGKFIIQFKVDSIEQ